MNGISMPLRFASPAVLLFLWLISCGTLAGDDAIDEETAAIEPPRVYQEALILREEVEQIRRYLGIRPPRERSYKLKDALPRQTFYQSQTLFRKSNQLANELAGVSRQRPAPAPNREIVPGDVLKMLQGARGQLAYVKQELGIDEGIPTPKLERRRTPSDVMREIIESGYVINELVATGANWTDIYDRVFQMVAYAGGVLPQGKRYPELPEFVCCKQPQDVYESLVRSLAAMAPVSKSVNYPLVQIIPKKTAEGGASPDTVYDLTTTMISDMAELTLRLGVDEDADLPSYERPKRILPANVHQLAMVLERQVELLAKR